MTIKYSKKYNIISTLIGIINGLLFAILLIVLLRYYLGSEQTENNFKNILSNNDLFTSTTNQNNQVSLKNYKFDTSKIDDTEYKKKFRKFIITLSTISGIIIVICSYYIIKLGDKFEYVDWFFEVLVVIFIIIFNLLYFNIISKNYTLYNISNIYEKLIKYNKDTEYYHKDCEIENSKTNILDEINQLKKNNLHLNNIDVFMEEEEKEEEEEEEEREEINIKQENTE